MLGVMELLTDKTDWHKKVFDDSIVEKWREEAMAIPDEEFMKTAAAPRSEWDQDHPRMTYSGLYTQIPTKIKGIMSKEAFDYVGSPVACDRLSFWLEAG